MKLQLATKAKARQNKIKADKLAQSVKPTVTSSTGKRIGRPPGAKNRVKQEAEKPKASKKDERKFELSNITGSYALECRAVSTTWSESRTHKMSLDICAPEYADITTGGFDLDFLAGALRLSTSEADLNAWCKTNGDKAPVSPPQMSPAPGDKRTSSDEPDGEITEHRRSKRIKTTASAKPTSKPKDTQPARQSDLYTRVYFNWQGRNIISDQTFTNIAENSGWLDFADAKSDVFWGVIDMPSSYGNGLWIHGVRKSSKVSKKMVEWESFDEHGSAPEEQVNGASGEDANGGVNGDGGVEGGEGE